MWTGLCGFTVFVELRVVELRSLYQAGRLLANEVVEGCV